MILVSSGIGNVFMDTSEADGLELSEKVESEKDAEEKTDSEEEMDKMLSSFLDIENSVKEKSLRNNEWQTNWEQIMLEIPSPPPDRA